LKAREGRGRYEEGAEELRFLTHSTPLCYRLGRAGSLQREKEIGECVKERGENDEEKG